MSEPMSEGTTGGDTTGTGSAGGEKGNSTLILVLGIISLVCSCYPLGPIVWYMGKKELEGIAAGRIAATNEGTAKAGMILGIITTCLLVFAILWIFFFGGMAILGAALEQ